MLPPIPRRPTVPGCMLAPTMAATLAPAADYMQKEQFLKNFWEGFQDVLGRGHVIKSLDKGSEDARVLEFTRILKSGEISAAVN